MVIEDVRQADVAQAVVIEQHVIGRQIPDGGDVLAAKGLIVFGERGSYARLLRSGLAGQRHRCGQHTRTGPGEDQRVADSRHLWEPI